MRTNKSFRRTRRLPAILPCLLSVAVAVLGASASAESTPRDLIRQGNAHYAAGQYQEALEAYAQAEAAGEGASSAELLHNQAAAKYRLGQFDDARDLWGRARQLGDAAFEARTRYNLGNCDYAEALNTLETQDMNKAVELLGKAAGHYRDAVALDPTLADARANLELTHLLKKQIEELMEQQPQQDQQHEQDKEGDQNNQNQQPQASSRPSEQDQQPPPEPNEQDEQSESQEQQGQQQQDPNQATGTPQSESQPQRESGEEESDEQRPPIEMTEQQAERLLQMVRDAEKQRREMLARRQQARYKPVERDW